MADYKSTHTGAEIDAGIDKAVTAESNWSLLMANLGIGRWRNATFRTYSWLSTNTIYDNLAKYYSNCSYMFSGLSWVDQTGGNRNGYDIHFNNPTNFFRKEFTYYTNAFASMQSTGAIYLPTLYGDLAFGFSSSLFNKVLIEEGCTCRITVEGNSLFNNMPNLTEIGAFDMSLVKDNLAFFIQSSPKVKSIHCTHWKTSFNISHSTAFEESDLVEIISNLDAVTTAQTLTMGTTNLAKLTDDEKKVATDKGWVLA